MDETILSKRKEILEIASSHGAKNVRIFGSFAKGNSRPDSDVDVLVDMEPGRSILDVVAIKQDLEDLLGRKVDVVTEPAISKYIRDDVLQEAVHL
ncbi:MAG: nucleotidyltransferase family protein [Chloroflexi bacterium]|nr:nucleotidyltransferase family protein [Chloroflexota bacterium]